MTFAILFAALTSTANAQDCGCGFTTDDAAFADMALEDFETYTSNWTYRTSDDPLLLGGGDLLLYNGWTTTSWSIPNMDTPTNDDVFFATDMNAYLVPTVPIASIGFTYGSQWTTVHVDVTLSDGSMHAFDTTDLVTVYTSWGSYTGAGGFLGFTAPEGLDIVEVHVTGFDGGLDDIRWGNAGPAPCSPESLRGEITDLVVNHGVETSLMAKLDAAEDAIEREQDIPTAVNQLGAMVEQLDALRGKQIGEEEADRLMACVQAWIDDLAG